MSPRPRCKKPGVFLARGGRCATVGRQGWMKAAGAFLGRPRELRMRHNIIPANACFSSLELNLAI